MSDDGRMLAMYLLTCPHGTIAGAFRLPDGYVCDDMQWSAERVSEGFKELLSNGFANRCETSKWVWVNKHFEWNQPENPNQRKAVCKIASQIPDQCTWKAQYYKENAEILGVELGGSGNPSGTVPQPVAVAVAGTVAGGDASEVGQGGKTGTRLPPNWSPDADLLSWAKAERPDINLVTETASFVDYWVSKPGKDGRKTDWNATYRNWIRRANAPPGARTNGTRTESSPASQRAL
jgi:hypothetical protein